MRKPVSARKTKVRIPARRCCAPGCGDKIKPMGDPELDWMWRVRFDDGSVAFVEQGLCEDWFENGHPDYGGGHGVELEDLERS